MATLQSGRVRDDPGEPAHSEAVGTELASGGLALRGRLHCVRGRPCCRCRFGRHGGRVGGCRRAGSVVVQLLRIKGARCSGSPRRAITRGCPRTASRRSPTAMDWRSPEGSAPNGIDAFIHLSAPKMCNLQWTSASLLSASKPSFLARRRKRWVRRTREAATHRPPKRRRRWRSRGVRAIDIPIAAIYPWTSARSRMPTHKRHTRGKIVPIPAAGPLRVSRGPGGWMRAATGERTAPLLYFGSVKCAPTQRGPPSGKPVPRVF